MNATRIAVFGALALPPVLALTTSTAAPSAGRSAIKPLLHTVHTDAKGWVSATYVSRDAVMCLDQ